MQNKTIISKTSEILRSRSTKAVVFKVFIGLALLIGVKLYLNNVLTESNKTTEDLKKNYPEKFHSATRLADGHTHFEYNAPSPTSSHTVVMIHGVSGPMSTWEKLSMALNNEGYSTLRYDLFGRGFSERLERSYDLSLYVKQLGDLLDSLNITSPVQIIGSSFGCVIAAEFARLNPKQVLSLTFIGPAGFNIETPFLAELRDVPILGNVLFNLMGKSTILEQNQRYFVDQSTWFEHRGYFLDQLEIKGSPYAILSTMRNSPVQNAMEIYKGLGLTKLPVLVIWGEKDQTFPFHFHLELKKAIPAQDFIPVPNSAHLPHFERPEFVTPYILSFLDKFDRRLDQRQEEEL